MGLPWFPVDVDATILAAFELSVAARGAHLTLQAHSWRWGALELVKLPRLARVDPREWPVIWEELAPRWIVADGRVTCPELEEHRARAERATETARSAGRASGEVRRSKYAERHETERTTVQRPFNDRSTTVQPTLDGGSTPVERTLNDRDREGDRDQEQESAAGKPPPAPEDQAEPLALAPPPAPRPRKPRQAKQSPAPGETPAVSPDEALAVLSRGAGVARFVPPDALTKGQAITAQRLVKRYPDARTWQAIGEWLAAGGEARLGVVPVGLVLTSIPQWAPIVREWHAAGRPPIVGPGGARPAAPPVRVDADEIRKTREWLAARRPSSPTAAAEALAEARRMAAEEKAAAAGGAS